MLKAHWPKILARCIHQGGRSVLLILVNTGLDRMRQKGTSTRGYTAVHANVLAWPCLLATSCFFFIHFLFDLNFISTIRGSVNHAVIIHELLTCFLFQVLFNITSHEMYYITAVIIPVIKTAYCEIYYKARQPLVSSFCSNLDYLMIV